MNRSLFVLDRSLFVLDKRITNSLLYTIVSLLYASFMLNVPWEDIGPLAFADRAVYIDKFVYGTSIIEDQQIDTLLNFFLYEAVWDISVRWVVGFFNIEVDVLFNILSFFCIFIFCRYCVSRFGLVSLVFLVNPLVVDLVFSQFRMAFAGLFLLVSFSCKNKFLFYVLSIFACFLHTASLIFVFMYVLSKKISYVLQDSRMTAWMIWLALISIGFFVALAVGPGREFILGLVGDRRAIYSIASSSFMYALFWIFLLAVMCFQRKQYFSLHMNFYSVSIVALFVFSVVFSVYGSRFLAVAYPSIIGSVFTMDRAVRRGMCFLLFLFILVQWYFWLAWY